MNTPSESSFASDVSADRGRTHLDVRPIRLLPELEARGARYKITEQIDGSRITTLRCA